jgi:hypothetical protein
MSKGKKLPPAPKLKTKRASLLDSRGPITQEDIAGTPTFEEGLQRILKKFSFPEETRRKIFSQLTDYAGKVKLYEQEQQAGKPQKGSQNDDD